MPRVKESNFVTFYDGVLDICAVENRSLIATKVKGLRFGNRTVGSQRFWNAQVSANEIERLVAVLPHGDITTKDVCVIDDRQYKILQVQDLFDAYPPCRYLSLASLQIPYKDVRS